jgi:hypothetical protein
MRWKFKEFLEANNITAYRLGQELSGDVAANLPYAWARLEEPPQHLHLDVLEKVLMGLESLTGRPVAITDILEYRSDLTETAAAGKQ